VRITLTQDSLSPRQTHPGSHPESLPSVFCPPSPSSPSFPTLSALHCHIPSGQDFLLTPFPKTPSLSTYLPAKGSEQTQMLLAALVTISSIHLAIFLGFCCCCSFFFFFLKRLPSNSLYSPGLPKLTFYLSLPSARITGLHTPGYPWGS
jgi:hypothetical protein